MKACLANPVGQVPDSLPQLICEPLDSFTTVAWQAVHGQPGQGGYELSQRGVACDRPAAQPPVKPEDSVPAAVGGKVPGEHEEPDERFLGWTQEPEHPDLRGERRGQAAVA